ncbi:MAG: FtsK/SpoIIIE domain-containing protein [Planctomycetota bacterium]
MNSAVNQSNVKNRSNLVGQYRELSGIQARAVSVAARCRHLQLDLEQLTQQSREAESALRASVAARQSAGACALESQAAERLDQAAQTAESRRTSLQQNFAGREQNRLHQHGEAVAAVRSRLQNDLWVLNEVLDENREDSPLSQAERARENYATQDAALKQRLEDLDARLQASADYLEACHAAHDESQPTATIQARTRDAARTEALEWIDQVVISSGRLNRLTLPQWVLGVRLYALGLLIFLSAAIVSLVLKADLSLFLNPGLGRPDWQWFGISCLIGAAFAFLFLLILLSVVQSRLRGEYEDMLQQAVNGRAAADLWRSRSRQELKRLEQAAEQWAADNARRRQARVEAVEAAAAAAIAALETQLQSTGRAESTALQRELADIASASSQEATEIDSWLQHEQAKLQRELQTQLRTDLQSQQQQSAARRQAIDLELATMVGQWRNELAAARLLAATSTDRGSACTDWTMLIERGWTPPEKLPLDLAVGMFSAEFPQPPPPQARLTEPFPDSQLPLQFPGLLRFPADLSIALQHDAAGRETALDFLRLLLLRLLTTVIPGRVQFTLIDPGGLGQSFSAMMHLADFDELLIDSRIWTDSTQIRERLQKVTEHMENVFQTYLRSEFETLEDYNAAAGEVAEPYHFVVIAGFPVGFTEESCRHLSGILTSGARCGVHVLMTWSPEQLLPRTFDMAVLREGCLQWQVRGGRLVPDAFAEGAMPAAGDTGWAAVSFRTLAPPDAAGYVSLVRSVGAQSRDARRVEVSFSRIAPKANGIWSLCTAEGIDLPIGRAGAARLQSLRLGRGTSQHVLIAGKTGSGKSTLMHILITNLALYYSPQEIQFYLIDFKKGVEFRAYAACGLPHARVIAIESDREFGLSVLERLDAILQERGELFRQRGVQDVPSFRREYPREVLPRLLLLIDEFQEFFTAEDRVSARAALLLDRLIRQGRAFGIHAVLGSQTLGGAYSLARSTLGQVAVRIALQCSENDAHLILSEDNSAARLLSRPGEAIYNDANGMVEGNHPFQIAWLDEDRREEMLGGLRQRPGAGVAGRTLVFEGNVPPRLEECEPLNRLRAGHPPDDSDSLPLWIGEPVSIAAPVCVSFKQSTGQNLLIAGQESDQADAIFGGVIVSAAARAAAGLTQPHLRLLHDERDSVSRQQFAEAFAGCRPDGAAWLQVHGPDTAEAVVLECWQRLRCREGAPGSSGDTGAGRDPAGDPFGLSADTGMVTVPEEPPADAPDDDGHPVLLLIRNIGQFRSLRREEDDFGLGSFGGTKAVTPASRLGDLIRRGPQFGIHVLIWSDTFSNVIRWLSTALLKEFDFRIAFRLNQTDSASLLDTPAAAALTSGRAILYQDQTGETERFRPWVWPLASGSVAVPPGEESLKVVLSPREANAAVMVEDELPDIDDLRIE